ncbi:MAG: LCP family protein [Candidatus Saccharibacteria bacterium]|nr:LCP family protein [Candidatus Saccharibacteria bacterium]
MNILNDSINLINKVAITNNSIESTKIKPSDIAFNVYISGIDTYGEINTVSRSDVNIVATINLTKKQLLLTTIPRDSYVPIALGGQNQKDKLTHAGNYGIESSVKTVENLLNIKIPIYIKVNFSSFIKIIDILGGVEVNNPVAFDSFDKKHFPVGKIVLNGKEALSFTRERKSLSGGDVERGKNQQRVIEAVFNKMVQEKSLSNYQEIFNAISDSVQTNLSADSLIEIINKQTINGNWHMESLSLEGYGQTGGLPSFAMPGYELYMYVLSDYSIQNAHNKILKVLEL